MKPPNPDKIGEQPMVLPEILYLRVCQKNESAKNYRVAYRRANGHVDSDDVSIQLLSRYRKNLIGREVWVCLDVSNGNPDVYQGRVYVWLFNTKEKALQHCRKHVKNKWAKLRAPVRCLLVDDFVIK